MSNPAVASLSLLPARLRPPASCIKFIPKPENFTPVYEAQSDGSKNYASLDAGNEDLWVGGGGINGAFGRTLSQCKHSIDYYKGVHHQVWKEARKDDNLGTMVELVDNRSLGKVGEDEKLTPVEELMLASPLVYSGCFTRCAEFTTTACFIDIFKQNCRPLMGNNVALVYAIGPRGDDYPSVDEFLEWVRETGQNIRFGIAHYNEKAKTAAGAAAPGKKSSSDGGAQTVHYPKIDEVRICLISGGIFAHEDADKVMVAGALMRGLFSDEGDADMAPKGSSSGPDKNDNIVYEFCYDEDVFRIAFEEMWKKSKE